MTPPPANLASDASSPTLEPTNPPDPRQPKPQTRASDLDASDAGVQTSAVSPDHVAASGRYVLTAFHARGGMGEVWRCQDATIGREVALKRLVSERSAARERFICEAQVTGQLQHPGIVPVHDLGFDDNGRPYYVMTFVQGQTLKAAIEAFHSAQTKSDERPVARTRLLKIFLDVCNAVAYAHSRGIIHRDLKPDNIMLGAYGETVLLDWGLAKLKDRSELPGPVPPSAPPMLSSGSSVHTEDGSIMGSPLYMPPEMAQGHIADADARTDVYLLGATLYEILTGRPPRHGASRDEILEMARTSAPVPARKIQSDTPRALEAICIKAMSSERSGRYESASEMAEEIQRFLAGERVQAYPEPLPARLWRWTKRHHRVIARSAAAAAIVACVFAGFLAHRDAARLKVREQARLDVQHVRKLIDESHFYAANIDPPGEVAPYYDVGRGERAGRDALAAAQKWGPTLAALPLDQERDALRRELTDLSLRLAQLQLAHSDPQAPTEAIALIERAEILTAPTPTSHRLRAAAYRASHQNSDVIAAEQMLADVADPSASAHDLFLQAESLRIEIARLDALVLRDPDARRASEKVIAQAAALYQAALRKDPTDFWAHFQLARCYLEMKRGQEAVEALGACIALRPDSPWAYSVRGLAQALLHRFEEAKLDLDRALELEPNCVAARLNRGIVYQLQHLPIDAAREFDALLAQANPPPEAAIYRGQLYLRAGDPTSAIKMFGRFSNPSLCLLRADAHLRLGQIDEARHDLDPLVVGSANDAGASATRGHLLRCIAAQLPARYQLAALDLAIIELKRAVEAGPSAAAFADLGAAMQQQGRHEQAIEPLTRAIALAPDNPQVLINRGWVNERLNRFPAATADFAAAIRLSPNHAEALTGLGYIAARTGNTREAQLEASLAQIVADRDYRILHNVACIYGQLSVTDPTHAAMHENTAIDRLNRSIDLWQRGWGGVHEIDQIKSEVAFPASLRARKDFQNLLAGGSSGSGGS
jgi:tetratricopeptide (TPR) repeat protein